MLKIPDRILVGIIIILLILISMVSYILITGNGIKGIYTPDPNLKQFSSPHGTVTYKERGGVGPQTSRDILLSTKLLEADLVKDTASRDFIIKESRETGTIFIEKGCILSPISIAWQADLPLKISNEDVNHHTISFLDESHTIPAHKTITFTNSLPTNTIVKLSCDKKIQGYLYLVTQTYGTQN